MVYVLRECGEWPRAIELGREVIANGAAAWVAEGLLGAIHLHQGKPTLARGCWRRASPPRRASTTSTWPSTAPRPSRSSRPYEGADEEADAPLRRGAGALGAERGPPLRGPRPALVGALPLRAGRPVRRPPLRRGPRRDRVPHRAPRRARRPGPCRRRDRPGAGRRGHGRRADQPRPRHPPRPRRPGRPGGDRDARGRRARRGGRARGARSSASTRPTAARAGSGRARWRWRPRARSPRWASRSPGGWGGGPRPTRRAPGCRAASWRWSGSSRSAARTARSPGSSTSARARSTCTCATSCASLDCRSRVEAAHRAGELGLLV